MICRELPGYKIEDLILGMNYVNIKAIVKGLENISKARAKVESYQ
jgi:uncharacterized protein (DUF169 family)